MSLLRNLASGMRSLFRKEQVDRELDEELGAYLEMAAEEKMKQGMSRKDAHRAVRLERGSPEVTKEIVRSAGWESLVETCWQDVRYAARTLRKSPGFTAVAVLTLALGIGVNTTLFTAFDAVALKSLPVTEPKNVVRLVRTLSSGGQGDTRYAFSYPEYAYFHAESQVFSGLIAASWPFRVSAILPGQANAGSLASEEPQVIQGQLVSSNYFAVLGTRPIVGSLFLPVESQAPGTNPFIALSYPFWQGQLDSDPQIVGKVIKLNGAAFEVAGVASRDFIGTANPPIVPDFWAPLGMQAQLLPGEDWLNQTSGYHVQLLARLERGTELSQAQADVTVLAQQFQAAEAQPVQDKTVAITLQHANYFADANDIRFQAFVTLLMVAVGLVLVVACANLANMLLSRGVGRQRETGIRLAMGASRRRLIQQWLTESILLALLGGAAGLFLSLWTTTLLRLAVAPVIQGLFGINPSVIQLSPDLRVFTYTLLISIITGVAFGLSPALQFTKADLAAALKDEGTAFSQRTSRSRLRDFLLGAQVAISMLLLISASLLLRGLLKSQTADPGFETKRVFPLGLYFSDDTAKSNALATRVISHLTELPVVASVGLAHNVPWLGTWTPPVRVEGTSAPPKSLPWQVLANYVSPGYFSTLSIPILRGRNFTLLEGNSGAPVAIVSQATAQQFWPGEDPVGKRLKLDLNFRGSWTEFEVIGVVKDVRTANLSRVDPGYIYVPTDAAKLFNYSLLLRTHGDTNTSLASVRAALEDLDRTHFPPGMQLTSLEEGPMRVQEVIPHAISNFATSLSVLALLLALVGVNGVMAYFVSQRSHEIGVRMALGGTAQDILRWTVRSGMRPALIGAMVGLVAGLGVATFLRAVLVFPGSPNLLFGVSAFDPLSFVVSVGFLLIAALVVCYIPARHAMRVDPMVALRYE